MSTAVDLLLDLNADPEVRSKTHREIVEEMSWNTALYKAETRGEARGKARGKAEGLAEGKAEEAASIAQNMKKEGMSPEVIARITGLSISVIEKL